MAKITAKGKTEIGRYEVEIEGEGMVDSIKSPDAWFARFIKGQIRKAEGHLANGFYPEPNTMLQAYATCRLIFKEDDISVDGDIGRMEVDPDNIY